MRLLVPTATVLLGGALLAVLIYLRPDTPRPSQPLPRPPSTLVGPQQKPSAFSWQLVGAASYAGAMVLEVETARPGEARAIAQQLTEPYKKDFDEVLVYIFEPNAQPRLAVRRVQWTRRGGYKTMELGSRQP